MGSGAERTRFGVSGFINFVGEELPVLAQGDSVDLSTRDNFHSHQFCAIFHWKLEPGVEGYFPIRCTLSEQGTVGMSCGFDTVGEDHISTVLGVLEGVCQ